MDKSLTSHFVQWFRSSAPYIHTHRGKTFVVVFGGEMMESDAFASFVHDIALLQALGIQLVLVAGARPQIDKELRFRKHRSKIIDGIRITDSVGLECVKAAAGAVRTEMEARLSMGVINSPMAGARIRVSSGNFVIAQPMGVIDGVDYQFTGRVRRVDTEAMRRQLQSDAIVLLTSVGYSATGEVFNLSSAEVAQSVASALHADKLICMIEGRGLVDSRRKVIAELTTQEAEQTLKRRSALPVEHKKFLQAAIMASKNHVKRVHLLGQSTDGNLLTELFTREGEGTLISHHGFEDIRPASIRDVGGLLELIRPLEKTGVLKQRPKKLLEKDIDQFYVIERDGMKVACAALYPFPSESKAELACFAVHPDYQGLDRASVLLEFLEHECKKKGIDSMFVLTTQSAHWFVEHGFERATTKFLPKEKRQQYSQSRKSHVFVKRLT